MRRAAPVTCSLLLLSCVTTPPPGPPKPQPVAIPLTTYPGGQVTAAVEAGGAAQPFLFDTAASVTVLAPDLARRSGCEPYGRLTVLRVTGQRVELPQCAGLKLKVAGAELTPQAVGVFEVGSFLPRDWPPIAGVLTLAAFEGRAITIDLGKSVLVVETEESVKARVAQATPVPVRLSRTAAGAGVDALVRAETARGPLWLVLDSGSPIEAIIARHAAPLLPLSVPDDKPQPVRLQIAGMGEVELSAIARELVVDGDLGAPFLKRWVLTLDLAKGLAWVQPAAREQEAPRAPKGSGETKPTTAPPPPGAPKV